MIIINILKNNFLTAKLCFTYSTFVQRKAIKTEEEKETDREYMARLLRDESALKTEELELERQARSVYLRQNYSPVVVMCWFNWDWSLSVDPLSYFSFQPVLHDWCS